MRTAVRILGTRLWWRHTCYISGDTSHEAFIRRFNDYASPRSGCGLDRRSLRAWDKGLQSVSQGIVHRVESRVPGTKFVYAIVALLTPKRLSASRARGALADNVTITPDGTFAWRFPPVHAAGNVDAPPKTYLWSASEQLASRRDFLGILAILVLLREAMARSDFGSFKIHAEQLYLALPDVIRLLWVKPDTDLLLQCIEHAIGRFRFAMFCPLVDWSLFREKILTSSNERRENFSSSDADTYASEAGASMMIRERPVPLLPDVDPLEPYVIRTSRTNDPSG